MEQLKKLKNGQQVVIKSAKLSGTVIGPRHPDDGTEYEGVFYKVQISEQTMWLRRENLEPWPEPDTKLTHGSKEWLSELTRFNEMSKQYLAKPHDQDLVKQLAESGAKLGFFIPIE